MAARTHQKPIVGRLGGNHCFSGVYFQIVVEHEVNIVRQEFFTSRLLSDWFQSAFAQLELVRSREKRPAYRVMPNRIGNRTFLYDEIVQAFLGCGIGCGKSSRTGADDDQIKVIAHSNVPSPKSQVQSPKSKVRFASIARNYNVE